MLSARLKLNEVKKGDWIKLSDNEVSTVLCVAPNGNNILTVLTNGYKWSHYYSDYVDIVLML